MIFVRDVHAGVISDAPTIAELMLGVVRFLLTISGVVAVIAILIAGIMYITAGDSIERAGFAKKALWGSVIGLTVILLSLGVVKLLVILFR